MRNCKDILRKPEWVTGVNLGNTPWARSREWQDKITVTVDESSVWIETAVAECSIGLPNSPSQLQREQKSQSLPGRISHKVMLVRLTPHWAQKTSTKPRKKILKPWVQCTCHVRLWTCYMPPLCFPQFPLCACPRTALWKHRTCLVSQVYSWEFLPENNSWLESHPHLSYMTSRWDRVLQSCPGLTSSLTLSGWQTGLIL